MGLTIDAEKLGEVLQAFYRISGIRAVLFDAEYNLIMAYPLEECAYCACIKRVPESCAKCMESDRRSFQNAARSGGLIIYKCHAGLVEAALPLKHGGATLGYAMFGQISDEPNPERRMLQAEALCAQYGIRAEELLPLVETVLTRSEDDVRAAAKILETCATYILSQEMMAERDDRLMQELDRYIFAHLSDDISIPILCDVLQVSRTRLYKLFGNRLQSGIADYVRTKRMEQAKILLRETDRPISEIAEAVGFADYNYFRRVFKQLYGRSPKEYRY